MATKKKTTSKFGCGCSAKPGLARGSMKYAASAKKLDDAVAKHARSEKGTLRVGQRVGAYTITAVGTHTVNYRTPDGYTGTVQIPWVGSRGESLPSHKRALAEAGYARGDRSGLHLLNKSGASDGYAAGRSRKSYSEWLYEVDDALVAAGIRTGIDNISKTWLRVHFADGSAASDVVAAVKSYSVVARKGLAAGSADSKKRYTAKDIPKAQIEFLVGRMHVADTDAEVEAEMKKRLKGQPEAFQKLILAYAVKVHHKNRDVYSAVMGGRLGRGRAAGRSGGFYGTSRNVNQQFTKKGRHGTLRRYAIEYDDPIDPGFGKSLEYTWAYDVHHAIDMFMESLDGDSWRPLRIAAVTAGSPYGWHWQKV